jgi:hypothetical protein
MKGRFKQGGERMKSEYVSKVTQRDRIRWKALQIVTLAEELRRMVPDASQRSMDLTSGIAERAARLSELWGATDASIQRRKDQANDQLR